MRNLYTFLGYLILPLALLRLIWKGSKTRAYFKRWNERFGYAPVLAGKGVIWIHAVSVGETVATVPMVKRLQALYPNRPILMTNITPTGSERAKSLFGDTIYNCYLPYDLPVLIKRFLDRVQPSIAIIMETELWPNTLHYLNEYAIPSLLANARLSPRSAQGYGRVKKLTKQMLNDLSIIAAQSQQDSERFLQLGAPVDRTKVIGNIKFDVNMPASVQEKSAYFTQLWGQDRSVWIAASTHEGEDEIILQVAKRIRAAVSNALLVLVPRHPERFAKVAALCEKQGFKTVLRSKEQACNATTDVFIGDSMGELGAFYAASDVAFVGGSLVPIGGHNLLEPAALGIPAITGPHVFNFTEITRLLDEAKAIQCINNADELVDAVLLWFNDPQARNNAGEQGRQVVQANRGAVDAHIGLIEELMTDTSASPNTVATQKVA